jgi:hypothetical protein
MGSIPSLPFFEASASSFHVKYVIHETSGLTSPSPSSPSPFNPITPTVPSTSIEQKQQITNNASGSNSYSIYSDPILGISIQYPANYEVKEAPNSVGFASLPFEAMPPMDSPESLC